MQNDGFRCGGRCAPGRFPAGTVRPGAAPAKAAGGLGPH
ncbi:hypothetical protein BSLA_01f2905 [Burkholderia stabilis]|nr:hypothetical protein BSLA_01f2905 [Burkholderia stabilis]